MGIPLFEVPIGAGYSDSHWRDDLRKLVRETGTKSADSVLMLTARYFTMHQARTHVHVVVVLAQHNLNFRQLLRTKFLLKDVVSLLVRGTIDGLFTLDEKYEMNEVSPILPLLR